MSVLGRHSDTPPPTITMDPDSVTGFPGFGEGAPLDLPHHHAEAALSRLLDHTHDAFAETLASVGNCLHPIRLTGHTTTLDTTTGEVLSQWSSAQAPLGELYRPCGNRRAHICPACSRTYARDTFSMIKAGIAGGKTIPTTVAHNPLLFLTLTAPSFGHVHSVRPDNARCRPRTCDRVKTCPHGVRLSCMAHHDAHDKIVGAPLCWDCHDWATAVIWQWHAPELWRRTTITLRRALATRLGVPVSKLNDVASLQYAKTAEFQARGLVHFHALIRLDGPHGPGSPAPLDTATLAQVVEDVVRNVTCPAPPAWDTDTWRRLTWGQQLDIRTVRNASREQHTEDLSANQVAGYLAKYATKDASTGGLSQRPHIKHLAWWCHKLARHAAHRELDRRLGTPTLVPVDTKTGRDHYALLKKWAHMAGFRGHFSTKSRRYSLTLSALRRARTRYRRLLDQAQRDGHELDTRNLENRLLADNEDDTTLVIGQWTYTASGWPHTADAALAAAAAARAREYTQWKTSSRQR